MSDSTEMAAVKRPRVRDGGGPIVWMKAPGDYDVMSFEHAKLDWMSGKGDSRAHRSTPARGAGPWDLNRSFETGAGQSTSAKPTHPQPSTAAHSPYRTHHSELRLGVIAVQESLCKSARGVPKILRLDATSSCSCRSRPRPLRASWLTPRAVRSCRQRRQQQSSWYCGCPPAGWRRA